MIGRRVTSNFGVFLTLISMCSSCAQVRDTRNRPELDPTPHFMLFSWITAPDQYRFVIIRAREWPRFIEHFNPQMSGLSTVAALKIALDALPRPVLVIWSAVEAAGLKYPPDKIVTSVERFARSRNIHLQVEPMIEEPGPRG